MKSWLGESIGRACVKHDTALWGYVFMPEHVHLMVYPRLVDYDISEFLRSVKESTTRKAMAYRRSSERNESIWKPFLDVRPDGHVHFRLWQRGSGYDRNIVSSDELREKLRYMHNNPVARGLCETPLDWAWSSAAFYERGEPGPLAVEFADSL